MSISTGHDMKADPPLLQSIEEAPQSFQKEGEIKLVAWSPPAFSKDTDITSYWLEEVSPYTEAKYFLLSEEREPRLYVGLASRQGAVSVTVTVDFNRTLKGLR